MNSERNDNKKLRASNGLFSEYFNETMEEKLLDLLIITLCPTNATLCINKYFQWGKSKIRRIDVSRNLKEDVRHRNINKHGF